MVGRNSPHGWDSMASSLLWGKSVQNSKSLVEKDTLSEDKEGVLSPRVHAYMSLFLILLLVTLLMLYKPLDLVVSIRFWHHLLAACVDSVPPWTSLPNLQRKAYEANILNGSLRFKRCNFNKQNEVLKYEARSLHMEFIQDSLSILMRNRSPWRCFKEWLWTMSLAFPDLLLWLYIELFFETY